MKYTVLIYETEADFSARADAGRREAYWGAYRAYTKALVETADAYSTAVTRSPTCPQAVTPSASSEAAI